MRTLTVTGHRPPKLCLGYGKDDRDLLGDFALRILKARATSFDVLVSGMALGWDMATALAAISIGKQLVVALPFRGQCERWRAEDRAIYQNLLGYANEVYVARPKFSVSAYLERDRWMVDRSTVGVLACWNGQRDNSGTAATVAYAVTRGVKVESVWPDWTQYLKGRTPTRSGSS